MLWHIERTNLQSAWKALYAVANLCQLILTIEFLDNKRSDKRSEGRSMSNLSCSQTIFTIREMVCNVMFLCQHLGVAPEEGAYSRDKMSARISPPYAFE